MNDIVTPDTNGTEAARVTLHAWSANAQRKGQRDDPFETIITDINGNKAPQAHQYSLRKGEFVLDQTFWGEIEISAIAANGDRGIVKSTHDLIGVKSFSYKPENYNITMQDNAINHLPDEGGTETLILRFPRGAGDIDLTLVQLGAGEGARWRAYDESGDLIDSGVISGGSGQQVAFIDRDGFGEGRTSLHTLDVSGVATLELEALENTGYSLAGISYTPGFDASSDHSDNTGGEMPPPTDAQDDAEEDVADDTPPADPVDDTPPPVDAPPADPVDDTPPPVDAPPADPVDDTPPPVDAPPADPVDDTPPPVDTPPADPVDDTPPPVDAPPADPVDDTPPPVDPAPADPVDDTPPPVDPAPADPVDDTPPPVDPAPADPVDDTPPPVDAPPVDASPVDPVNDNPPATNTASAFLDFVLVDTDSDLVVSTLTPGTPIDASLLEGRSLALVAAAKDGVEGIGSVRLDDGTSARTENAAPYAQFGDSRGDFRGGRAFAEGDNVITVSVFSGKGGKGTLLETIDLNVLVAADGDVADDGAVDDTPPPIDADDDLPPTDPGDETGSDTGSDTGDETEDNAGGNSGDEAGDDTPPPVDATPADPVDDTPPPVDAPPADPVDDTPPPVDAPPADPVDDTPPPVDDTPPPVDPAPADPVDDTPPAASTPSAFLEFFLVDTKTNEVVVAVTPGTPIDASLLEGRSLALIAEASEGVDNIGSVRLDDGTTARTENAAPYAQFGDFRGNFMGGRAFAEGDNVITISVFSGKSGKGTLLETIDLNVLVASENSTDGSGTTDEPPADPVDGTPPPVDAAPANPVDAPPADTSDDAAPADPVDDAPPTDTSDDAAPTDPVDDTPPTDTADVAPPSFSTLAAAADQIVFHFDGNNNDGDDISAMPVAALIASAGGVSDITTFFYGNNLSEKNAGFRLPRLDQAASVAEDLGVDTVDYQDGVDAATDRLVEIFNSGQSVLVLEGGPMEATYRALEQTSPENLANITLVSHGQWNERRDVITLEGITEARTWDDLGNDFPEVTRIEIIDQNGRGSSNGLLNPDWDWMDASDLAAVQAVREIMTTIGTRDDASDAGMLFYALTGEEAATPDDVQLFVESAALNGELMFSTEDDGKDGDNFTLATSSVIQLDLGGDAELDAVDQSVGI